MHLLTKFSEGKPLVIKMMNVGGRMRGWTGVNNLSPDHNSATVRNSLIMLDRITERVIAECRVQEIQPCLSLFSNYVP